MLRLSNYCVILSNLMLGVICNGNIRCMKPILEQSTTGFERSISVIDLSLPSFEGPFHFHPEVELTWIKSSFGRRYLGSNASDYEPNDLVLVGANTPHCWRSTSDSTTSNAEAIVIQVNPNFAGVDFWRVPELSEVYSMLSKSHCGILIGGVTRDLVVERMVRCAAVGGVQRVLLLLEMLDLVARSRDITYIDPLYSSNVTTSEDSERFRRIFDYLIQSYQGEISLKSVSEVASMTPTSFCRYFKSITRKSLVEVVTELRINQACLLLRSTEKSVAEVCFESGFGNISYFNKTFRTLKGSTPLQFRRHFREGV